MGTVIITPESDAFLSSLVKMLCLKGYCHKCVKTYQLSMAKLLMPEPQILSLDLNGFFYGPCPVCREEFKICLE